VNNHIIGGIESVVGLHGDYWVILGNCRFRLNQTLPP